MSDHGNRYPAYRVDWGRKLGQLLEPFEYQTKVKDYAAGVEGAALTVDGVLQIEPGYMWDFGSGPAIDTPDVVYASLCHDVLYDMMNQGVLPWDARLDADRTYRDLLKSANMWWFRRWYHFLGVRIGYPILKLFR